jgi:hypothetical protein
MIPTANVQKANAFISVSYALSVGLKQKEFPSGRCSSAAARAASADEEWITRDFSHVKHKPAPRCDGDPLIAIGWEGSDWWACGWLHTYEEGASATIVVPSSTAPRAADAGGQTPVSFATADLRA